MLDTAHQPTTFEIDNDAVLDPLYYFDILKKRKFYALIPFIAILAVGWAIAMLWPPTYLAEGKILVVSQQIPVDLVRPTVTASASERISTIEQRVMTRDNLLKIVDKYQMYADQRSRLSRTDLLDLMRSNTTIKPLDIDPQRRQSDNFTIAVTVGFLDRRPDVATKVANELITLFLNEDARNRTNRATETTRFLEQEVSKLQVELAAIDEKMLAARRDAPLLTQESAIPQLSALKAELAAKAAVFSQSHPEVRRLKAQIEALEKEPPTVTKIPATTQTSGNQLLDPILLQRLSVQANLESTSQKLAAARRGENLERDQFSERLEVLEQAIPPQKPIKPNRFKLIGFAFAAAVMAAFASIWGVETIDKTVRRSSDLLRVSNGQLIVGIPYIVTQAELHKKKNRLVVIIGFLVTTLVIALLVIHFMVRPLDELWPVFLTRLGF
jgi:uncharacterized protein involved in exopolysaccharide biosynthesis